MPSRKSAVSNSPKASRKSSKKESTPQSHSEGIPAPARFALAVLSSLVLSSALFTATSVVTIGDLGFVSKHLEKWWEVGGLIAWRAVELGLAWVLGFDGRDVAFFTLITHLPTFSLLSSFYGVRPTTTLTSLAITLVSNTIPFILLRGTRWVHNLNEAPVHAVSNRAILQDTPTTIYTSVAASAIYAVFLYTSFSTWLPAFLVVHFEDIPDIRTAHAGPAGLPVLFLSLIPLGYAARDFLFVSSTGWTDAPDAAKTDAVVEGEFLISQLYRKTWGSFFPKTKILISRTVLLAAVVLLNTIIQAAGTVKGIDVEGAAGWGAIWAAATVAIGATFGWIERVDGV
ncbi:hypothetical protein Plec18167_001652 [Paecilomyces lecythidis]|uniref:Uncharacterized protein n=1 Tax=Paecilomyces lecythidis TaxID=3004212 RepID=A0ABR3Y9K5_9EURO